MEILTIGFTQTSAANFFGRLRQAQATRLIDVRLHRSSQLAGFAKQLDLEYFVGELCGMDYVHEPLFAPTAEMLDEYKKRKGAWAEYERRFLDLLSERKIETNLDRSLLAGRPVLLCSEAKATYCHRRLVVEYLADHWGEIAVKHL